MRLERKQNEMKLRQAKIDSVISIKNYEVRSVSCDIDEAGVYLVGSTTHGWYKIGQSQQVSNRVRMYRSLPFVIDTIYTWMTGSERCQETEKRLHALVTNKRLRANGGYSEWFALDCHDIQKIKDYMDR
jgi:hypothetical protein